MSDYLLLGGIVLGVLSVIIAIIQLLQTRPPRAAAIMLVLAILAILAGGWLAPEPFRLSHLSDAWTRISGGEVGTTVAPAAETAAPDVAAEPAETADDTTEGTAGSNP